MIEKQPHNCKWSIKCRQCGVCPDLFTCVCVDYALHSTACKHTLLLCLMDKEIIADTNDHSPIEMQSQQSNMDDTHS